MKIIDFVEEWLILSKLKRCHKFETKRESEMSTYDRIDLLIGTPDAQVLIKESGELIERAPLHHHEDVGEDKHYGGSRIEGSFVYRHDPTDSLTYQIEVGVPGRFLTDWECLAYYRVNLLRLIKVANRRDLSEGTCLWNLARSIEMHVNSLQKYMKDVLKVEAYKHDETL